MIEKVELMSDLYIKGVVIANGIPDSDGDILNKKQIKQIFTKYNGETDTMHTYIKNEGVDVIENWITETPTQISGKDVPSGSWLCTCKISNPELIKAILDHKLNSFSLGSVPVEATSEKYWFINKSRNYRDYANIEDIKPLFVSLVDSGANGYNFEVMTYDVYINKNNKNNGETMEEEKNTGEMISLSAVEKIAKIFGINKIEKTEKAKTDKKTDKEDTGNGDITNRELLDSIKSEIASGVVDGLKAYAAEIKTQESEKPKTDKKTNKEEAETDEKNAKPDEEEKDEEKAETPKQKTDKVKTNKRETKKTEQVTVPEVNTSFYKQSGRDEFGCKIRK